MCCLRFDADVLLANIYGSQSYNKDMEIKIQDFLDDYCDYLNNILPGYKYFSRSPEDIEDFVRKYQSIFQWKDEKERTILQAETGVFNPDYYNRNYPGNTGDKLKFAADICLGVLSRRQKREREMLMAT